MRHVKPYTHATRAHALIREAYAGTYHGYLGAIRDMRRVRRCGIREAIARLARLERNAMRAARG